jgi:RNA polymerase sigma-70 factor, ECF subfamily
MLSEMEAAKPAVKGPGDNLAEFVEVAQRNRGQLLWVAWRMTSSREEAEDIVQEALLKAFNALPRFRGDSRMDTWLHTIVRNAALGYLRKRKGRIEISLEQDRTGADDTARHELPDPSKNPEEHCERRELENMLRSSMDEMTSVSRFAIQMCVLEELPYCEVADNLNVSIGTLKSRVFQGKRMLKRAMYRHTGVQAHSITAEPIANLGRA